MRAARYRSDRRFAMRFLSVFGYERHRGRRRDDPADQRRHAERPDHRVGSTNVHQRSGRRERRRRVLHRAAAAVADAGIVHHLEPALGRGLERLHEPQRRRQSRRTYPARCIARRRSGHRHRDRREHRVRRPDADRCRRHQRRDAGARRDVGARAPGVGRTRPARRPPAARPIALETPRRFCGAKSTRARRSTRRRSTTSRSATTASRRATTSARARRRRCSIRLYGARAGMPSPGSAHRSRAT